MESVTPCHDAEVVGLYLGSNPARLTLLAVKSEDYTTAPQLVQCSHVDVSEFLAGLPFPDLAISNLLVQIVPLIFAVPSIFLPSI